MALKSRPGPSTGPGRLTAISLFIPVGEALQKRTEKPRVMGGSSRKVQLPFPEAAHRRGGAAAQQGAAHSPCRRGALCQWPAPSLRSKWQPLFSKKASKKQGKFKDFPCFSMMASIYFPKLSIISTISAPMRFWASLVAAPIWGVQETAG